jgi:hypothetical protein
MKMQNDCKSNHDDKRKYRQLIIMMKEIRSNYKSKMKDKKQFILQSEYIILIVLIIFVVIECFLMLHVFTKICSKIVGV